MIGGKHSGVGGLVGFTENANNATIVNSYATGAVTGDDADAGGLVGLNGFDGSMGTINDSYAIGLISDSGKEVGGFIGYNIPCDQCGIFTDDYWDTSTDGGHDGTGDGNVSAITGLTTKQLKSGLPAGFDPSIWTEKKGINKGMPYLIANPPPQ